MNDIPLIEDVLEQQKLLDALLSPLKKEVLDQQQYLKNTDKLYHSYVEKINRIDGVNSTSKYISETQWLKKELYNQLESEFPPKDDTSISEYFEAFHSYFSKALENIPEIVVEIQKKERFNIQASDSLALKSQKVFKQLFFALSTVPKRAANLFNKEKKAIAFWNHKIPLRAMLQCHFQHELLQKSLSYFNEIQQLKCDARNIKWLINKDINLEIVALLDKDEINFDELKDHLHSMAERKKIQEVIDQFDKKLNDWKAEKKKNYEESLIIFKKNIELVDTIELDSTIYSASALRNNSNNLQIEFKKILNGWRNTQYAQIDDFQIDLELYQLKYSGLTQYYLLDSGCKTRIDRTSAEYIEPIRNDLAEVIGKIKASRDLTEIKGLLIGERIKLHHRLEKKSVPAAITALYENNFPNMLERLESKIKGQLDLMKTKRIIYSKETYDAPIAKSNLSHFNPKELVEFDLITPFSNNLLKLKSSVNETLSSTEVGLRDLVGIVDYNLDAATNSAEGELSLEEIKSIVEDGLERARSKAGGLSTDLNNISQIIGGTLKQELDLLNKELLKLTNNENITSLRLKLAKAKAVERTESYRKEFFDKVRNFVPIASRYGRQKIRQLNEFSTALQERVGLIEVKAEMTSELSDFLSQSQNAIQQLPYVYRRLYEIKPLEEEGFFEGRTEEVKKVEEAFKHWQDSNTSSAVIVGEKGSGASSIINQFVRNHHDSNIVRRKMVNTACTTDAFSKFFSDLLEDENLNELSQIAESLNAGSKRVIIVEDIQNFYLKIPNGFEAITLLFELISQTAKNIFWLVSTSSFSWSYFQKTIAIERYIRHKIVLHPLTNEQIIRLIMKRHRVSGYNLKFDDSKVERKDILSSIRKPIDHSQDGLKKAFFADLNAFAQSNISLALLYWLRSTISFEENTVVIGKIKNIKFDFLNTLDSNSIFTLHSLLLHDSLSVKEHSTVFHQAEKESRMTLMVLEDSGILTSDNGEFKINQLIYRQVINVLQNKNLIH